MRISSFEEFEKALENGPYAFPGGYPLYFIMSDGEPMSFKAAQAEKERIREAFADRATSDRDWIPLGVEINYEDQDLYCCHTNEKIEVAYPADDQDETPAPAAP